MNPQTPANTVIYVIANLQGCPSRFDAAFKCIRQSPPSDKKTQVCVIMGDLINVESPDTSIALIDKVREASQFMRAVFIKGQNERDHADHIDNPQKFELRRSNIIKTIGDNPMARNIARLMEAHQKFRTVLSSDQAAFFSSWQEDHREGDFLFTTHSANAESEHFSISSSSATPHHLPHITTRTLTTSGASFPAVNLIRLEDDRMTITVIGDSDMKDNLRRKCDLERTYGHGQKAPNRTYHFKRAGVLTVGNGECPVWRTDVTIRATMAWDRNRLEAA